MSSKQNITVYLIQIMMEWGADMTNTVSLWSQVCLDEYKHAME